MLDAYLRQRRRKIIISTGQRWPRAHRNRTAIFTRFGAHYIMSSLDGSTSIKSHGIRCYFSKPIKLVINKTSDWDHSNAPIHTYDQFEQEADMVDANLRADSSDSIAILLINLSFSPINGKTCYTYLCIRIVADPRGIITNRINTIIFARSIASLGNQHENGMKTDTHFIGTYW